MRFAKAWHLISECWRANMWGAPELARNSDLPLTIRIFASPSREVNRRNNGYCGAWDMSLAPPVRFGTQAMLYLTDTAANQGAFSCVQGFHRKLEKWLKEMPAGTNPRERATDPAASSDTKSRQAAASGPIPKHVPQPISNQQSVDQSHRNVLHLHLQPALCANLLQSASNAFEASCRSFPAHNTAWICRRCPRSL